MTLPGEVPDPASPPPGCAFQPRCALAIAECAVTPPDPVLVADEHLSACVRPAQEVAAWPAASGPEPAAGQEQAPDRGQAAGQEAAAGQAVTAGQAAADAAVRLQDLTKAFAVSGGRRRRAKLTALRGVDLTVREGESVAIVGESGSGKSTLLRIVAGLERGDHGQVELGPGARPQMVFQDAGASLTPWLSVETLITERLRGAGVPAAARRQRVRDALAHVGLPAEVAAARAAQLSGGQRQRVALARATVIPPEVLLCDEPTSALDVSLAAGVLNLIGRLRRELGMAVLFVTHDLSVARVVADRIAVMYLGRVVELGEAAEVVARPRHPYTRALVSAVPELGAPLAAAFGESASPLSPPPGCAFHPRCPDARPACADRELTPALAVRSGGTRHAVACIRPEVS